MNLKERIRAIALKQQLSKVPRAPQGFLTAKQWQAKWRMGRFQTRRLIDLGLKSGILCRREYHIIDARKHITKVPFYGEVKK